MSYRDFSVTSAGSYPLSARLFDCSHPSAVVQIVHGMEEHKGRYDGFAQFLQQNGVAVLTCDLRGHGQGAPVPGHIADRNGALLLVQDALALSDFLKTTFPGAAHCLLGHSMGSLIVRKVLQTNSADISRVVLLGYPAPQSIASAGVLLARALSRVKGPAGYSSLLDQMALGNISKAVPNAETPHDWLSYNRENLQIYLDDPLCGQKFTIGSYEALFSLVRDISHPEMYRDVHASLPILMLSGSDDPCTGGEKGRRASLDCLARAGFRNLRVQTMEHMRHEVLNEKDHRRVYRLILDFLVTRA